MQENTNGRPSKYKDEYCQLLLDYFSEEPYREVIRKVHTKQGDVIEIPEDVANDFPTLAGFAIKIGVHRDTLLEWSKQFPEFSGAYKRASDFQEHFIVTNGMKSLVNPAFAIFTAKNVLKWRDKQPGEEDKTVTHAGEIAVAKIDLQDRITQLTKDKKVDG